MSTVALQPYGAEEIRFSFQGPLGLVFGPPLHVQVSRTYRITILTDANVHLLSVTSQQGELLSGFLFSHGPVIVHTYNPFPGSLRSRSRSLIRQVPHPICPCVGAFRESFIFAILMMMRFGRLPKWRFGAERPTSFHVEPWPAEQSWRSPISISACSPSSESFSPFNSNGSSWNDVPGRSTFVIGP